MTSKIFIATKDALFSLDPFKHTYLVFDADGDRQTVFDQTLIASARSSSTLSVVAEIDKPLSLSLDNFSGQETPQSCNFTEINLGGRDAAIVKQEMIDNAKGMTTSYNASAQQYTLNVPYFPFSDVGGQNCNSFTSTVLSLSGIDFFDNRPRDGGIGDHLFKAQFPKAEELFAAGSLPQTLEIFYDTNEVTDYGTGDTTIVFDVSKAGQRSAVANIELRADLNISSVDKLVVKGVDTGAVPIHSLARVDRDVFGNVRLRLHSGDLLTFVGGASNGFAGFNSIDIVGEDGAIYTLTYDTAATAANPAFSQTR